MKRLAALFLLLVLAAAPLPGAEMRKYGQATTVFFPLTDPAGIDLELSAICAAGDVQISKDGGAFANTTNCFTNEGSGWYSLALTATEMQACSVALTFDDLSTTEIWLDWPVLIETYGGLAACHAFDLDSSENYLAQASMGLGTVDNGTFAPTSTQFEADDIPEATTSHFVGRRVIFVTGALAKQAATITGYVLANGKGKFTVTQMTEAPANNDVFVIL